MKKIKNGFTLVELIVVVVILSILAVIAFMSVSKWIGKSRDANRRTTVSSISQGLQISYYKNSSYPMPDKDNDEGKIITGEINGVALIYKGTFGNNVIGSIGNSLNKVPTDPLDKNKLYAYGITADGKEFEIGTILENNDRVGYFDKSYAVNYTTLIDGTYNGLISFSTGGTSYIANIPSLIYTFSGSVQTGINLPSDEVYFSINNGNNLPYSYGENYQQDLTNKVVAQKYDLQTGSLEVIDLTSITNLSETFSGDRLKSFGGSITKIESVINDGIGLSIASQSSISSNNCNVLIYSGYNIPSTSNGLTGVASKDVSENNGIFRYSISYQCLLGLFDYGTQSGPVYVSCNTNYQRNGSICEPQTKIYSCSGLPVNAIWNNVGSFTQTWNGTTWLPADSIASYNLVSSSTECRFKCADGYLYNAGNCIVGGNDSYTKLLLHFDGNILDSSASNKIGGVNNGVTFTTGKFGSAGSFNAGITLTYPDSADWDLGTSDFTIDFWANPTVTNNGADAFSIVSRGQTGNYRTPWYLYFQMGGLVMLGTSTGGSWDINRTMVSVAASSWNHYALTRTGNQFKFFKNGILVDSWSSTINFQDYSTPLILGYWLNSVGVSYYYKGLLDEFRLVKGKNVTTDSSDPLYISGVCTTVGTVCFNSPTVPYGL